MTILEFPKTYRQAQWMPDSFDEKDNLINVVWTTGARVKRRLPTGEPFEEELAVREDAVRLNRLNQGAPVLNGHRSQDVTDVIGVVERAWIEGGKGYARLKFSNRKSVAPIIDDIKQGVLRNCSVGYVVHQFEEVSPTDQGELTLRAIDWEPQELSIVAIAADPGAQIRSSTHTFYPCSISLRQLESKTTGEDNMPTLQTNTLDATDISEEKTEQLDQQIADSETNSINTERNRISEIIKAVRTAQLDPQFAEGLIDTGVPIDKAREKIIDAWAALGKNTETKSQLRVYSGEVDEVRTRRDGIEHALLHRFDPRSYQLTEKAKPYANFSLLELARVFVQAQGNDPRGLSRMALAERALHTTSDFPQILANVANKTLRNAYESAPQTFKSFVRSTTVNDFKMITRVQLGDGVKLNPISEHGEFTYGTLGEAQEQYKVATYGKIMGISRQSLVNDDLDAFTRIPQLFGRAAATLESDLVYQIFTQNLNMHDGKALFSAQHDNIDTAGAPLSIEALAQGRKVMRLQTGLGGARLNLYPSVLLVPANLEVTADQLISQNFQATQSGDINPFAGRLQVIVEPRLDEDNPQAWYLLTDNTQIDLIEMAYLSGNQGVSIETRHGFEVDGIEIKARLDVGVKVIDWRGLYKNVGNY